MLMSLPFLTNMVQDYVQPTVGCTCMAMYIYKYFVGDKLIHHSDVFTSSYMLTSLTDAIHRLSLPLC